MKDNPFYLTFKGLEELVKEMEFKGKDFWASKGIKKTEGMFEEIVNPLDATVAKHLSLLADIKRQTLYRYVVTFLKKHKKLIEEEYFFFQGEPNFINRFITESFPSQFCTLLSFFHSFIKS